MIEWPTDLVSDIARRRCVLFLGSGVSKSSVNAKGERPKDWKEYLNTLSQKPADSKHRDAVKQCINDSDLLTACELAKKFLHADVFNGELLAEYSDKAFLPSTVHDDIIRLDSRFVLTTNFDKLYENRANHVQQSTVRVTCYYDAHAVDVLRRPQRCVLKVHGTIDSPSMTIFTRSDYARARANYGSFYGLVEALFLTHTFVFLGASMRDPDIQLLLEDQAYRFEGARPHFLVTAKDAARQAMQDVLAENMNLRPLFYDPADNHAELAASLKILADLVDDARETLTKTMDW